MRVHNFGGSGRNLAKFYQRMWLIAGVIRWTLILQRVPLTKFGRVKTSKNNFRVWSQVSQEWIDISKIRKVLYQLHFIPYCGNKFGELWSTNQKVKGAHVDPPNWNFSGDYMSALKACWPLKFLHTLQQPKMYFKSGMGRRAASCWALPHISSYFEDIIVEWQSQILLKLLKYSI